MKFFLQIDDKFSVMVGQVTQWRLPPVARREHTKVCVVKRRALSACLTVNRARLCVRDPAPKRDPMQDYVRRIVPFCKRFNVRVRTGTPPEIARRRLDRIKCYNSPMIKAVKTGDIPTIRRLIRLGVSLDKGIGPAKKTPLIFAVETGQAAVAELLLEEGADPNTCQFGRPLVITALAKKRFAIVKLLLLYGAKMDPRSKVFFDKSINNQARLRYVQGKVRQTSFERNLIAAEMSLFRKDVEDWIATERSPEEYLRDLKQKEASFAVAVMLQKKKTEVVRGCLREYLIEKLNRGDCITQSPFKDPVMTYDGQVYDRKGIAQWLSKHNTSPNTGKRLQFILFYPLGPILRELKIRLPKK